ncbi:hypothetical protein GCM10018779_34040 [Streptomyces griseocarneus]|nr:hypothetical protein GCM10018779_34040 [Streptomyces griseocarneus]
MGRESGGWAKGCEGASGGSLGAGGLGDERVCAGVMRGGTGRKRTEAEGADWGRVRGAQTAMP